MKPMCICGCGARAAANHHVVFQQHCRRAGASVKDRRNLVPVAMGCHADHHSGKYRLALWMLPDEAFAFAAEALGSGRAYEYLRRGYRSHPVKTDPRLMALLDTPDLRVAERDRIYRVAS